MITLESIKVFGNSTVGDFSGELTFKSGLQVISADNAFGKSLSVTTIAWCLSAKAVCSGSTCGSEIQRQAVLRPEALAGRAVIAQPLQRRRGGAGQQAGTHGMGRSGQRRSLSTTGS